MAKQYGPQTPLRHAIGELYQAIIRCYMVSDPRGKPIQELSHQVWRIAFNQEPHTCGDYGQAPDHKCKVCAFSKGCNPMPAQDLILVPRSLVIQASSLARECGSDVFTDAPEYEDTVSGIQELATELWNAAEEALQQQKGTPANE